MTSRKLSRLFESWRERTNPNDPGESNSSSQSSVAIHSFCGGAGLLSLAFRRQRAKVRYALWLAASVKFLIPFAMLVSIGKPIGMARGRLRLRIRRFRLRWNRSASPLCRRPRGSDSLCQCGARPDLGRSARDLDLRFRGGCSFRGWFSGGRIRAAVRTASPLHLDIPLRAMSSKYRWSLESSAFSGRYC